MAIFTPAWLCLDEARVTTLHSCQSLLCCSQLGQSRWAQPGDTGTVHGNQIRFSSKLNSGHASLSASATGQGSLASLEPNYGDLYNCLQSLFYLVLFLVSIVRKYINCPRNANRIFCITEHNSPNFDQIMCDTG